MSIPKEPRQIMINLMYIVLTAMLALNVSAEVLNAFFALDKSITNSSEVVEQSNTKLIATINKHANAYPQFEAMGDKANQLRTIAAEFHEYVGALKSLLIENSGGIGKDNLPKGKKDKDVTTRLFVKEGRGEELQSKIEQVRQSLLALIESETARSQIALNLPLRTEEIPADSKHDTWAAHRFKQMPVAATLPILTKLQNDIKISETAILNHIVNQITDTETLDQYDAIVSANKSYVIKGEAYEAEIFLGAYSSTVDNVSVSVNGKNYPVRNGKAQFSVQPNQIGTQSYEATIRVKNPLTQAIESYKKRFAFEVGERSVTAAADKMNVFYVGVDNPLSISAAGVPSSQVQVTAQGAKIKKMTNGKYNVTASKTGKAIITVAGGGLAPTKFEYRVKPIPTPVAKLGDKTAGTLTPAAIKIHDRLFPHLERFDFEARCKISGFELTRLPKGDDPQFQQNRGGRFNSAVKNIIKRAQRGDVFYFDNVKAKCPGDQYQRTLNSLVFNIK